MASTAPEVGKAQSGLEWFSYWQSGCSRVDRRNISYELQKFSGERMSYAFDKVEQVLSANRVKCQ